MRFWGTRRGDDDVADVEPPQVALSVPAAQVAAAMTNLSDPTTQVEGEVLGVASVDGQVVATLSHRYDRRTAVLRRLDALHRAGVEVSDFVWLDPVTDPDDRWLDDVFTRWESGRDRDQERLPSIEIARRRMGRLHGQAVLDRTLELVASHRCDQRRRRTVAHAAALAGFNTHTTEAGNALITAGVAVARLDGHAAMSLLDGARGIAGLGRFGIRTDIAEAPLVPLVEHDDWPVHNAATQLLSALSPPRSDAAAEALIRVGHRLARGSASTAIRAEYVVAALATTEADRADVDVVLDELRGHASSAVRADAATTLARRRPERARSLWEPWLSSRSMNERTAAESMIARWGDERDVPDVVRIVAHRTKPPKGTTYWPPLAAEGLDFLVRHAHVPESAAALDKVRRRWDDHDDDLRRWLRLHHPDLSPATDHP